MAEKPGATTTCGKTCNQYAGSTAKAKASKTNRGTVERMDRLVKERPDLAEKVKVGEIHEAAAGRHVEEKILVEFTPGVRAFAPVVEVLSDEYRVVEWDQPGVGLVRGCAVRTDTHNGCGEFLWAWDGTFEPVEEEQQAAG